jgi:hypothetical protein
MKFAFVFFVSMIVKHVRQVVLVELSQHILSVQNLCRELSPATIESDGLMIMHKNNRKATINLQPSPQQIASDDEEEEAEEKNENENNNALLDEQQLDWTIPIQNENQNETLTEMKNKNEMDL